MGVVHVEAKRLVPIQELLELAQWGDVAMHAVDAVGEIPDASV
jgi:hypothetical protein